MCTVVVKPGAYLAITPGATIKFRPNCTYEDAKLWGLTDPGGVGVSKPSIVVMRGAKLYAAGTAEKPIVFRPRGPTDPDHPEGGDHSHHSGFRRRHVRGAWGGIVVMGTARVGWNAGRPTSTWRQSSNDPRMPSFPRGRRTRRSPGNDASHETHDYAVARVPPGCSRPIPTCSGRKRTASSSTADIATIPRAASSEHVVVLGGGGRNESNPAAVGPGNHDMPALGFFGCGFATKVEHVEVAHSAGHGLYLGGGMVSPRRVAAWDNAGAGVKTTAGYRGVLDELFVHVPRDAESANASGIRAEGFWSHGGGSADESVYRTHPMLFHATVVAEPIPHPPPMDRSLPAAQLDRSDGYGAMDGTDRDQSYSSSTYLSKYRIYLYPPVAKSPRIPMKLVKLSKTILGEPM